MLAIASIYSEPPALARGRDEANRAKRDAPNDAYCTLARATVAAMTDINRPCGAAADNSPARFYDRLRSALLCTREAVSIDPDFVDAWLKAADLCHHLRLPKEELEAAEVAARLAPESVCSLRAHALALRASARWTQSLAVAEEGLRLAPNDAQLLFIYGTMVHAVRQNNRIALSALEQSLRVDPTNREVHGVTKAIRGMLWLDEQREAWQNLGPGHGPFEPWRRRYDDS